MATKKSASVIDAKKYDYPTIRIRGVDGVIRHSAGNGDAVQKAMLLHLSKGGKVKDVIDANELEVNTKGKNAGLIRMSVGVALRALVKAGEGVKIGSIKVTSLKQAVSLPKVEALAPTKPKKAAKKAKKRAAAPAPAPAQVAA